MLVGEALQIAVRMNRIAELALSQTTTCAAAHSHPTRDLSTPTAAGVQP